MNSTQTVIAIGFTTLCAVTLAIAWRVIRSTSARERRTPADLEKMQKRENVYAVGIVASLIALLGLTIFATPYGETSDENAQKVEVESFQFGWTIQPTEVQAGRPVEFTLRSKDVQHGFGLYKGTELVKQVQVPANEPGGASEFGADQRLLWTPEEPGTYEVLCLEFCGMKHHDMKAVLEVTP